MYSSAISSKPQSTRSINTPIYPARPRQFSVRVFKALILGSCYGQHPKYDSKFQRMAVPGDYYSSPLYDDTITCFPLVSDPQRPSYHAAPAPTIRTFHLTARDFPSRPPTQSNDISSRGTINSYFDGRSDCCTQSDDTATDDPCSPSLSPVSSTMSIDSMLAVKSPHLSSLTERGERGRVSSAAATRHDTISGNGNTVLFPPLTGATGSTISRTSLGQLSGSHGDKSTSLAGFHVAGTLNSATSITIPPTSANNNRSVSLASKVSPTFAAAVVPPPSSSTSVAPIPVFSVPVPHNASGGHAWHSMTTATPSEAESEDVSLEARMNAEYNSIATGSLYTAPKNADNGMMVRLSTPGPHATRIGNERKGSPGTSSPEGTRLHIPVPDPPVTETSSDDTITEPMPTVARSPESSILVESLEEGRATSYMDKRNSTVVVGDQEKYIPNFADDRWVSEKTERERQNFVSYSRVPIPPPAPELRREYSNTRSLVSSADATCDTSLPRATVVVQLLPPIDQQRPQYVSPVLNTPSSSPLHRRSQAGHSVSASNIELSKGLSDTRNSSHPTRPSPPCQAEPRLNTSPRSRTDSVLGFQSSAVTQSSSDRVANVYVPPPTTHLENLSSSRPEFHISSRNEHRGSPPKVLAREMLRPRTTSPESSSHRTPSGTQYRSQSNSPPGKYCVPPPSSNDPYRTAIDDSHRLPNNAPHRPKSTAPLSSKNRSEASISFESYRSQSTVPQETSYRPQFGKQLQSDKYTVTPISSYESQTNMSATAVPTPAYSLAQPPDPRAPLTRTRTNSGSWSRNASFGSTTSTTPAPPPMNEASSLSTRLTKHGAPVQSRQVNTSSMDISPPPRVEPAIPRERGPPMSFVASVDISPSKDAHLSTPSRNVPSSIAKHGDGILEESNPSSTEQGSPQGKPILTVRNPSPSETSSERSSNPSHAQQQSVGATLLQASAKRHPPGSTTAAHPPHPHGRRSTLPYDSKTAGGNSQQVDDYGRRIAQLHSAHEVPKRRLSDGDQIDRPSFRFNPNESSRNPALGRCVRWNENLICPSPVLPERRKGWFNRHGDQLWTNEGAFKPPPPGAEYPPDLDDYPEYGEGWMNESGVRIDMTHHLIPKTPLRSALKQSKAST